VNGKMTFWGSSNGSWDGESIHVVQR